MEIPPPYEGYGVRFKIINDADTPVDGQTGGGRRFHVDPHTPPDQAVEVDDEYPHMPAQITLYFDGGGSHSCVHPGYGTFHRLAGGEWTCEP